MIRLFKKKPPKDTPPELLDIEGNRILDGDVVIAQRYELGTCTVELEGRIYYYVSRHSGQRMIYTKMIDAITGCQKVKKA